MTWNLIFIIIAYMTMHSAETPSGDYPVSITGTVTNLETVQDDITYFTWSVYMELKVENVQMEFVPSSDAEVEIMRKRLKALNVETMRFQQQGFEKKENAMKFLGGVFKGGKAKVSISRSSLDWYFEGDQDAFHLDVVEALYAED